MSDGFINRRSQTVEKVCFSKKSACSQSLTQNPFPVVKGCVCLVGFASCKALVHTRPASVPGLNVGLPPHQARTLAVSRTQSLHDAATPTTDNPYWGYAPNPVLSRIIKNIGLSTVCAIRYVRTAMCKALYQPINSFISEFSGTASGGTSFISDRNLGSSL